MARARAAANMILAQSETDIADLQAASLVERAGFRVAVEQVVQQMNIEAIIIKALDHLDETAVPHEMDDHWVLNCFDKCKYDTDEELQELWAKLIAGEANEPGTFSRKTVNVMADLDSRTANLFATFCRFVLGVGNHGVPLIVLDQQKDLPVIYQDQGIGFDELKLLAETGLITIGFEHVSLLINYTMAGIPETVSLSYGDQSRSMSCPGGFISVGVAYPTTVGRQLAQFCDPAPVEGFFDFIVDRWDLLCQSRAILTSSGLSLSYDTG